MTDGLAQEPALVGKIDPALVGNWSGTIDGGLGQAEIIIELKGSWNASSGNNGTFSVKNSSHFRHQLSTKGQVFSLYRRRFQRFFWRYFLYKETNNQSDE